MKRKIVIILLSTLLLSGCSNVSEQKYNQLQSDYDTLKQNYDLMEKNIASIDKKYKDLLEMQTNETEVQTAISENIEDKNNETKVDSANSDTNSKNELLDKIETTNEFMWDSFGYHYVGLELKNNTTSTIRLNAEFIFYDKENKIIGSKKDSYPVFESNSSILLYTSNEDPFDHYECKLNPSVENFFTPVNSQLKSEVNETDNKLIFSITNAGNTKAQSVKCTVLFLKEGKVVSKTHTYAGANATIEPGATERAEIKKPLNKPYDEYKVYIDGLSSISNN